MKVLGVFLFFVPHTLLEKIVTVSQLVSWLTGNLTAGSMTYYLFSIFNYDKYLLAGVGLLNVRVYIFSLFF